MTSRERVLTALNHKEPDRIPIDFGGMRSTGITAPAYIKLKKYLGIPESKFRLYDIFQQLAEPEPAVVERMHGDVIQLHRYIPSFTAPVDRWKDWKLYDGTVCLIPEQFNPRITDRGYYAIYDGDTLIAEMEPEGHHGFTVKHFPLAEAETFSDIDRYFQESDQIIGQEEQEYLKKESARLRADNTFAILGSFGGNLLETGQGLFGWGDFLIKLVTEEKLIHYFLDRLTEIHRENFRIYHECVGENIDIIQLGDDFGTQNSLQISPDTYKKMILPYQKRLFLEIRRKSDYFLFLHSCGAVSDIIPYLIEAGVQALNPVQTSARNMDPVKMKRLYGNDLTFWGGGVDTQKILPNGTPEMVKRDVLLRLQIFGAGGGFIFNQIHNIQDGVPAQNIVTAYDTAFESGIYPLPGEAELSEEYGNSLKDYWTDPLQHTDQPGVSL